MARKVILDIDPGVDDAVALCLALFDPELEVLAATAVAGNVPAPQATRNVQALVEQLDPPRWPRLGEASEPEYGIPADRRLVFGPDGLGDSHLPVAELHHRHPAEKVLADEVRSAPGEVAIIALGPLTNVAATLRREPALAGQIHQVVMMGGSICAPGNATVAAEFNIYCDPESARMVLRSPLTKTLVPLDVTSRLILTFDLLDQLPDERSRVGGLLRRMLPFTFRAHRERLGMEGIYLHDTVALVAAIHPEWFVFEEMAADVETVGELTRGCTVFDRRMNRQWRVNVDVAVDMNTDAVLDYILTGLRRAAQAG
jgi:inosine-uridine nucleoside N-ribohydrolase